MTATDSVEQKKVFLMHFYENRLGSFTQYWPFTSECECPPEKMASAGFYHCPTDTEPDLVKCAYCLKELDGWEPDDDPWAEHKSHSPQCPYLKVKEPSEQTVEEFLKLECERQIIIVNKGIDQKITDLKTYAKQAKEELLTMSDNS